MMKRMEMHHHPNISIVIPAYNNAKTLEVTIPAILNQKYDALDSSSPLSC
jgi:cellulose synthase/poly-beta-1,6-N-acetylglucosamine synthase-like glycosyltransferase